MLGLLTHSAKESVLFFDGWDDDGEMIDVIFMVNLHLPMIFFDDVSDGFASISMIDLVFLGGQR